MYIGRNSNHNILVLILGIYAGKGKEKYGVKYSYNKRKEVFYLINLKAWHVLRDKETGRKFCYYDDKDEPSIDLGEPNPMEGKEEITVEEWTAKEISDILSSVFDYRGLSELLVSLPEITLRAMDDCGIDEAVQAEIMREIMNTMISEESD